MKYKKILSAGRIYNTIGLQQMQTVMKTLKFVRILIDNQNMFENLF